MEEEIKPFSVASVFSCSVLLIPDTGISCTTKPLSTSSEVCC